MGVSLGFLGHPTFKSLLLLLCHNCVRYPKDCGWWCAVSVVSLVHARIGGRASCTMIPRSIPPALWLQCKHEMISPLVSPHCLGLLGSVQRRALSRSFPTGDSNGPPAALQLLLPSQICAHSTARTQISHSDPQPNLCGSVLASPQLLGSEQGVGQSPCLLWLPGWANTDSTSTP